MSTPFSRYLLVNPDVNCLVPVSEYGAWRAARTVGERTQVVRDLLEALGTYMPVFLPVSEREMLGVGYLLPNYMRFVYRPGAGGGFVADIRGTTVELKTGDIECWLLMDIAPWVRS